MLVGLTALSVEININLGTFAFFAASQITFVERTLFERPAKGFFSTNGTCL